LNTDLLIAGTTYHASDRAAASVWLDSWSWDLDSDGAAEFHELAPGPAPRFHAGQSVVVRCDDSGSMLPRFTGEIVSMHPAFTEDGWTFGYRALGLKYAANQLPITAVDGTGTIAFNLDPHDEDYLPSFAGQSVGQILTYLLNQHAAALNALGIGNWTVATGPPVTYTLPTATSTDLTAMDLVPQEPVYAAGDRFWQTIEAVLQRHLRNYVSFIGADGTIRFFDTTALADLTVTEGTDPMEPVRFARDLTDCATRVKVRGQGRIFPAYVSTGKTTLTKAWTSTQQTAWKYTDFTQGGDSYDSGTIGATNILDPVTVRISPTSGTKTWPAHFWNNRQAWIYLHSSVGSALTYTEARPITDCTALSAGGTSDITLGFALDNASSSAYDSYEIIGTYAPLSETTYIGSGGNNRNNVWRLYNVVTPGNWIEQHLVKRFPTPVSFLGYTGNATAQTLYPEAVIVKSGITWPASFKVMPATGQILFDEPVVKAINSQSVLNAGTAVVAPDDIYCLLAYSRGALEAVYPADSGGSPVFAGTAYTVEGLQRTKTVDVDSWLYQGNTSQMAAYAQMLHRSMCDTVLTGSVVYHDALNDCFTPGKRLNIAGAGYTTGLESAAVPVRSFALRYNLTGMEAWTSRLGCSSRRNPRTGDRQYVHPTQLQQLLGPDLSILGNLPGFFQSRQAIGGFNAGLGQYAVPGGGFFTLGDLSSQSQGALGAMNSQVGAGLGGMNAQAGAGLDSMHPTGPEWSGGLVTGGALQPNRLVSRLGTSRPDQMLAIAPETDGARADRERVQAEAQPESQRTAEATAAQGQRETAERADLDRGNREWVERGMANQEERAEIDARNQDRQAAAARERAEIEERNDQRAQARRERGAGD
jgi:hypothetical protein